MDKVRASEIVAYSQLVSGISASASIASAIAQMQESKSDFIAVLKSDSRDESESVYDSIRSGGFGEFVLAAQGEFGPVVGVVDAKDIAAYAAFYPEDDLAEESIEKSMESVPVSELVGFYEKMMNGDPMSGLFVVCPSCPVEKLIEIFQGGVSRVFVPSVPSAAFVDGSPFPEKLSFKSLTAQQVFSNVWTEYSQQLATKLKTKTFADKSIESLIEASKLVVVDEEANVKNALRKLMYSKSEVIAVVDPEGMLIRDLSAKDVLAMYSHNNGLHAVLASPIRDYFGDDFSKLIVAHPEDSVVPALHKLDAASMSRAWLVDLNVKPVSCVALESLIGLLSHV